MTNSAYLLFYRRRSDEPLGGPRFKAILDQFNSTNESSSDEESESGEDQGLGGNSSLRGSSRALTGAGAVHPQQNLGSSGVETKTINPRDLESLPSYAQHLENEDGAPPLLQDAELNDGLQLHNSIEEDEGIDMGLNHNNLTTAVGINNNWSGWSAIGADIRGMPSGTGSDMDVNSNFSDRSDVVQDNSSCGSIDRADRVKYFEDTPAVGDNHEPWVDPSPVPDVHEDGRVDMYDLAHDVMQVNKQKAVPVQQFHVPAGGQDIEEEVEPDATEIHVEEGEGLKIE